jgi:nucleotide-binding universal stress UspA family protein
MNILVPTDFTGTALNAVTYAANLARHLGARLKLLHVVTPYISKTTYLKINADELVDAAVAKLSADANSISTEFGIHCSFAVRTGEVAEKMLEESSECPDTLIVMGSDKRRYFLFGSITTKVVEKSVAPVLVLPRDMEFTPIDRIVFATDYQVSDLHDLQHLTEIARKFGSEVKVVHVVNRFEENEDEFDLSTVREFNSEIGKRIAYQAIHCEEYQYTDVPDGIQSYAEEEGADLLVVSTRQKKFIQRLFGKSVTKELLFEFDHPLLIYHSVIRESVDDYADEAVIDLSFT